jgi:rhodanese-related sulfurtransferase
MITKDPLEPPTPEELESAHFWFPEFPRITAEKLWSEMEVQDKIIYGGMTWDNFFIIDVQEPTRYTKLHLPGALNIPNSYYWVLDPREDPKPEEWDAYHNEQETLERRLPSLPRDELIIVYDTTADDEPASRLAKRLVEEFGFDAELVVVLWKGFYYWWLDLRYPVVAGDYAFPGE